MRVKQYLKSNIIVRIAWMTMLVIITGAMICVIVVPGEGEIVSDLCYKIISLSISGWGWKIMWSGFLELIREYELNAKGITVCFFEIHRMKYRWDEVKDIAVCDICHASQGEGFLMAIRFVVGEEKNGPLNPNCTKKFASVLEKWRDGEYHISHMKEVLLLEYSKERLDLVKELSGREIVDRRTRRSLSMDIEL